MDRSAGTHPIRQRLENLNEAAQLYGNIIYDKAPIVMRMLEELVGAERFRAGAAAYLKGYAFANASWPDLIDALDRLVPERRLRDWSRVWVEEAGRPIIRTGLAISPSGRVAGITLQQADPAGRGRVWTQPAIVALVYGDTARMLPVFLDGPLVQVRGAAGLPAPDFVLPNGDTHAYGLMVLDADRRAILLRALPHLRDRRLRGAAWLDAWDALLERQVAPGEFMAFALQALEREPDEQLQQRVLAYTADAYWHFLDAPARAALAPRLEQLLWSRLAAATTTSQRAAWFGTIRSVALTTESIERLRRIWAKQDSIPGLPLAEQDYTGLAMDLAVRGVAQADSILAAQETRIENPDRKARLAFVRPALSPDTAVRGAWFRSLAEPANRRHEPWVVEGLVYLDHPLRQADAERYLRPALDMLAEVRRTGDIFFPARWVNAALWGHTSSAAAGTVLSFLAANPDYPERLRQLVLQAADELFRVTGVAWPK